MATRKNDPAIPPVPPVPEVTPIEVQPVAAVVPEPVAVVPSVVVEPERPNPYAAAAPAPSGYAGPQYGAQPASYAYAPVQPGPPQGLSLAALICGIVGVLGSFAFVGFLPSLAGVIIGHMAKKRQPYAKPLWLTGLIAGYVGIGISVLWVLLFAVPVIIAIFVGISADSYGNF